MSNLSLLLTPQASRADRLRHEEHQRALREPILRRTTPAMQIAVRAIGEGDSAQVRRLAELDSAKAPSGHLLGAEVDGVLVAVLSLDDGHVISDPFRPSAPAVELLRLRAMQLRAPHGLDRLRRRRRVRARASLAGSPPGAGGRLLQL